MKKTKILAIATLLCCAIMLFAGCERVPVEPLPDTQESGETTSPVTDGEQTGEHTHTWGEWTTVKAATCTDTGLSSRTCTGCGETEEQTIPLTRHNYVNDVCTVCGKKYISSEGLSFTLKEDSYSVSGIGACTDTDIVIPMIYEGKPVTGIDEGAFWRCSSLTGITIPDSVTSIGGYAFSGCGSLIGITIPDSVTSIGEYAFVNCSSLTDITIPSSITSICEGTFGGCSALIGITIPDSVTGIGEYAFTNCSSLTSIAIPDGVTSIGSFAFGGCSSITNINVAEGNSKYHSAGNCIIETQSKTLIAGFQNSMIPADGSVTGVGDYAFANCSSLTSITIPSGVTSIGEGAFSGCSDLTDITIPDSVTSIGIGAFMQSGLTGITIPDSVTSIGTGAFVNCSNLTSITVEEGNTQYHSA